MTANNKAHAGFTILEVMIATGILLFGLVAVMNIFTVALSQNASQGELATRATEYSQDKMEQLMRLSYSDGATNTAVYPPASTGGTGLGGVMAAGATAGSAAAGAPSAGFVDYLDASGTLLASSNGAFYVRQWKVETDSTAKMKTITVAVRALSTRGGPVPTTTLVCLKAATS